MITLKNPETGKRHEMDEEAMDELSKAVEETELHDRTEVVFRAMTLDMDTAKKVLRMR